jgi:hypothetical protein
VRTPGKDGWILDLVIARYVNYVDLKNGTLDLIDLIKISDAHLIDLENQIRIKEFHKTKE